MSIMVKAGGGSGGNKYTGPNPLTIGADGYSFEPKTLLKDGLTILNGVTKEGLYVWEKFTAQGGESLGYVTADDETAYPDGGMLDGYWYQAYKGGGAEVTIDGVAITEPAAFATTTMNLVIEMPYVPSHGAAVVKDGVIHIMGGNSTTTSKKYHYEWNGGDWIKTVNLPYYLHEGCAVVYEGEIHILGTSYNTTQGKYHYKFDGTAWTKVSTLPFVFKTGCAVVHNGEIHILGGKTSPYTQHYKWNGSAWTEASTLPSALEYSCAVVYNNQIHIIGALNENDLNLSFYKWNGTEWIQLTDVPYHFCGGAAVVNDNKIHILGSEEYGEEISHYTWNGSKWTEEDELPDDFAHTPAVSRDGNIHLLGTYGLDEFAHMSYPHIELNGKLLRKVL